MKCFKKKLATGLLVVSVVCGLSSGAFAEETNDLPPKAKQQAYCEDVYNDADMRVLSCKINGKEFVIVRKLKSLAGIAITQVK